MTEERFTIDILDENNWLIEDTKTGETANPIDGTTNVLKGLVKTMNKYDEENEELKSKVKRYMEIELLKAEDFANCHNCRNNGSVHDGVALDGMCAINGLINVDGYFDTEYHRLPTGTICPCWELEE